MSKLAVRVIIIGFIISGIAIFLNGMAEAKPNRQSDDDLIARGAYLAKIASCEGCHTPLLEVYNDIASVPLEDLQVLAFEEISAFDTENRLMAGGRPFDLGPAGVVFSSNLTPDPETGLGDWTDEEIKAVIRTGTNPDGSPIHPLMPYALYAGMAEDDLDAIIAYLRSIPAVENEVQRPNNVPPPQVPPVEPPEIAPDSSDLDAYGTYLMNAVVACTLCHTPLDPTTGAPDMANYLAGGQPFEGPWGIVYTKNLTPHDEQGLGEWSSTEIERAIRTGVRRDSRRLILMPWQDYQELLREDMDAIVHFLQNNVQANGNEVPENSVGDDFVSFIESPTADDVSDDSDDSDDNGVSAIVIVLAVLIVVLVGMVLARRNISKQES